MVNHYGRFLPDLATTLAHMHQLLKADTKCRWSKTEQKTFHKTKELLSSPLVMTHFDSTKPLVLLCDASPYSVGSVLVNIMEDGEDNHISYHSRRLSPAEKNCAQIDKEGLAVIVGLAKFHKYLWGSSFPHSNRPPTPARLVWETRAVQQMLSPRRQRRALTLAASTCRA